MKLFWMLPLLILLFHVDVTAQELDKRVVDQVLRESSQGNPKAQAYLGGMYYHGKGVPLNHIKAAGWWRKAAEQGNASGQLNLGRLYSLGEGVPKDYVEATKWLQMAAEQGNDKAIKDLKAVVWRQGEAEAVNRYRDAAVQGDVDMQIELGNIYRYGRKGVTKDRSEAVKWYRKAVDQGSGRGAYELGDMFFYGGRSTKNHTEAAKWYRKAAQLGSKYGQYKLGSMYLHGEGVDKDINEAKEWFRKAAEQGSKPAKAKLYGMTYEGKIKIAFKEISQTIEALLSMLLFFPVWWLVAGYLLNCSPKHQGITIVIVFVGGMVGFFIAFACGGGAGGSSVMSASAWDCFFPYMIIQNIALAFIIFLGRRTKNS